MRSFSFDVKSHSLPCRALPFDTFIDSDDCTAIALSSATRYPVSPPQGQSKCQVSSDEYEDDFSDVILKHLDTPSTLAFALSCQTLYQSAAYKLKSTVVLDGLDQLVRFLDYCTDPTNGQVYMASCCPIEGHPIPHCEPADDHCRRKVRQQWGRSIHVRDLTLKSPGPLLQRYDATLLSVYMTRPWLRCTPGGLIGAVVRLCPHLRSLHIIDSSLPLHRGVAECLAAWCPNLQHLTLRTKHTDTASLASLIKYMPQLQTLDVAGVQTCPCRGADVAREAQADLAIALGSSHVQRLVLTSCRAFNDGTIFAHLVKIANSDDKDRPTISIRSLELHRINLTRPRALVDFLCSSVCHQLSHLYLGGLRRFGPSHLSAYLKECQKTNARLDLEVDARMTRRDTYEGSIWGMLSRLRLFAPNEEQWKWIKGATMRQLSLRVQSDQASEGSDSRSVKGVAYDGPAEIVIIPPHSHDMPDEPEWQYRHFLDGQEVGMPIRIGDERSAKVREERQWCRQEHLRLAQELEQQKKSLMSQAGGAAFPAGRHEDW